MLDPDPGLFHPLQQVVVHLYAAGPVHHDVHQDTGGGAFDQRLGELLAYFARPVDVGFERDRDLRSADRLEHGWENFVAVLVGGDAVAGQDGGP